MTDNRALAELSELLESVAYEAGLVILQVMARGPVRRDKADGTPVTEADTRAEALILDELDRISPDIPVLAEEAAAAGVAPRKVGKRFFLVDPLDGTRELVDGHLDFTVNIALVEANAPVLGVVYAPALGEMYVGYADASWFIDRSRERKTARQPIRVRRHDGRPVALASRSHRTIETERYLAERDVAECLAVGSSLKFCMLARGMADIYPRFGRTMEWDTAAGDAILRSAGGSTRTLDGENLAYGKAESGFANPDFIASSAC